MQLPATRQRTSGSRTAGRMLAAAILSIGTAIAIRIAPAIHDHRLQSMTLKELQSEVARNQADERALYFLSRRYETDGRMRDSMDGYWKAVQLDQDDEPAWLGWARTTASTIGAPQAIETLKTYLQRNDHSAPVYHQIGELYRKIGDFHAARDALHTATHLDPSDADSWSALGACNAALEDSSAAQAAFRRAVALQPGNWRAHAGLGDALSHLVKRPEAIACFREAVRLAQGNPIPHLLLGNELLYASTTDSEVDGARLELATAEAALSPGALQERIQVYTLLAESCRRTHHWREALGWYEMAEPLSPLDPSIPYGMAAAYRGLGDEKSADGSMRKHRELDEFDHNLRTTRDRIDANPKDMISRLKLARLYASHSVFPQAIAAYSDLLALDPGNDTARREMQKIEDATGASQKPHPLTGAR